MTRILIIDDDPDIAESLTMVLEAHAYEVQHLSTTRNLVANVTAANPDLIVLDVIFPEDHQAGFKAARTLAQDEELRRIPVLMLSAVNQESALAFAFSESDISHDFMPVQAFLEKPIQPANLLARIGALLKSA
jgi:CheY-like chemotaxis protein